ncbi:hypothetical protein G7Y89_g2872 [Cudoniella acicularis]|uniref:Uncharacterized protein n=1 Tax=Cudoniella acicularis TaxID=354080 RepID=A0A8H4RSI1_9HELO|nr:hypothetical protein G7Y89_g2872 [Cudoniella acicularis]
MSSYQPTTSNSNTLTALQLQSSNTLQAVQSFYSLNIRSDIRFEIEKYRACRKFAFSKELLVMENELEDNPGLSDNEDGNEYDYGSISEDDDKEGGIDSDNINRESAGSDEDNDEEEADHSELDPDALDLVRLHNITSRGFITIEDYSGPNPSHASAAPDVNATLGAAFNLKFGGGGSRSKAKIGNGNFVERKKEQIEEFGKVRETDGQFLQPKEPVADFTNLSFRPKKKASLGELTAGDFA